MRILYVDDHTVFRRTVTRAFLSGHEVFEAETLAEARTMVSSHEFDLLLVDFDLPDGKGDELVAELQAADRAWAIVAVSAHDRGNTRLRDAGARWTCKKSDFHRIAEILNDAVRGRLSPRS